MKTEERDSSLRNLIFSNASFCFTSGAKWYHTAATGCDILSDAILMVQKSIFSCNYCIGWLPDKRVRTCDWGKTFWLVAGGSRHWNLGGTGLDWSGLRYLLIFPPTRLGTWCIMWEGPSPLLSSPLLSSLWSWEMRMKSTDSVEASFLPQSNVAFPIFHRKCSSRYSSKFEFQIIEFSLWQFNHIW